MAFTLDTTTDRGRVRLLIGDTDSSNAIFDDDAIDAFLSLTSSAVYDAAALGCRAIAASAARCAVAYRVLQGSLDIDRKKIPDYFIQLADKYAAESDTEGGFHLSEIGWQVHQGSGIDETEYESDEDNQDYYGIHDYEHGPRGGSW